MSEWLVVGVAGLAVLARVLAGTWLHPAPIFTAGWSAFLAIPMVALPDASPAPMATLVVLVASAGVVASAALAPPPDTPARSLTGGERLERWVWIGSVAGCLAAVVTQRANSISVGDVLSLDSVAAASREVAVLRYAGDLSTPIAATGLLALMYAAAVMAPIAAATRVGPRRFAVFAAPAVGGAVYAVLTTARAPFLIAVMMTAASGLMVTAVAAGGRPKVAVRSWIAAAGGVAAVAFVFTFVAANRLGGWSSSLLPTLVERVALYTGGGVPAYDVWVARSATAPQLGAETFAGISQFVLLDSSLGAAYTDYVTVAPGLTTNVYTVLRPLTEDFGVAGATLFLAVGGTLASEAFRRATVSRSVPALMWSVGWVAFTLFSMTTSVWTFANVVAGFAVAFGLVWRRVTIVDAPSGTEVPAMSSASVGPPTS